MGNDEYCSICESKQFEDVNRNRFNQGVNNSLADKRKIQAACRQTLDDDTELKNAIRQSVLDEDSRKDAVKAKKAQEESDAKLAHQIAMIDLHIADQSSSSSSSSSYSASSSSYSASSQASRPVSSQAPPKSVKTVGMFDRATHRRVSGNGACFFTSVWYLLYGSGGMTSSGDVLQISAKQLRYLKQEVLDYLRSLECSNNSFKLDDLARFLKYVGLKKTIAEYARDLMLSGYYGGLPEAYILVQKCRRSDQIAIALVNMDEIAPDLSPVLHSPNCNGPYYKLGVLLFSGAHYELMINPNSRTGTFDVTHRYVTNELNSSVPELRRIASRLKRGGK